MNPDDITTITLKIINYLTEKELISNDIPDKCMNGEIDCPFCDGILKYWQTVCLGKRGFTCNCIAGATYQE